MLNRLFANPGFQKFYSQNLPQICFWVGLLAAGFYLGLFLLAGFSGAGWNPAILTPFNSEFATGLLMVGLSFSIRLKNFLTPSLFLALGLIVALQFLRIDSASEGIVGPVPVSWIGYAVVVLELTAVTIFYLYSLTQLRKANTAE